MEKLINLYREWSGEAPSNVEKLPGAGSNRVYYRLSSASGRQVIGCVGTSSEENHAFITLARHFVSVGLPVPEVLAASADELRYLQTDLGSVSLFDALRKGREAGGCYGDAEKALLRQTISILPRIQFVGGKGLDYSVCYPQPAFDRTGVMFDLNYFKYCYLKATGIDFHELRLEDDFRRLADDLTSTHSPNGEGSEYVGETFLYRDFQARNIMVVEKNEEPSGSQLSPSGDARRNLYFIDFQGGRRGPFYYDLASFLWQASARYPQALRDELIDVYYAEAQHYTAMPPRAEFDRRLRLFVLFRLIQVLGAYGFRGYFERKQHFIQSIPPALHSLHQLLSQGSFGYPHLEEVLSRLCTSTSVTPPSSHSEAAKPSVEGTGEAPSHLVVRIFSFSFKKGIPQDETGHGGGYVFDCRGTHNPGRYERYKTMTGLDKEVIEFLENDGEILKFLTSVYQLADAHVQRYVERGFTSLMFSFGCTGGQHRSVYSAQHLAEHLHQKFPNIEVRLCHREQGIEQVYKNT